MKFKIVCLLCITLLAWSSEKKMLSPSFDCTKVKKESVAASICADESLSALDNKITKIYKSFHPLTPELKEAQNKWINKRNQCKTKKCIEESYTKRIKTLQDSLLIQKSFPQSMLDIIKSLHKRKQTKADNESPKCMRFFNDLFLFQNIHVVKPILDHVDYNNTKLKKALGSCWDMRMDYVYSPRYMVKNFSIWYSDIDGDGKKNLIFGQHEDGQTHMYVLDKKLCAMSISQPDFNASNIHDRKVIYESTWSGDGSINNWRNTNALIEYKGKSYGIIVRVSRTPITNPITRRHNELFIFKQALVNTTYANCQYREKSRKE